MEYTVYTDRLVVSDNGTPKYGFKIKGGNYGDINSVRISERNRSGKRLNQFDITQAQYHGCYE